MPDDSVAILGPGVLSVGHGAYRRITGAEEKPAGLLSGIAMEEMLRIEQEKRNAKADRLLEFARDWQKLCPPLYFPDNIENEEGQKDYFDGLREVVPLSGPTWDTWASCALSEASWLSGDELESVEPGFGGISMKSVPRKELLKMYPAFPSMAAKKAKRKARKRP